MSSNPSSLALRRVNDKGGFFTLRYVFDERLHGLHGYDDKEDDSID